MSNALYTPCNMFSASNVTYSRTHLTSPRDYINTWFFLELRRIVAFFMSFMLDSSWMLVLYCDLLALSVEIALALACTRGHAHNVPFELSAFIGQFLARDFPKTSYTVVSSPDPRDETTYTEYIVRSILFSPHYLLLVIIMITFSARVTIYSRFVCICVCGHKRLVVLQIEHICRLLNTN